MCWGKTAPANPDPALFFYSSFGGWCFSAVFGIFLEAFCSHLLCPRAFFISFTVKRAALMFLWHSLQSKYHHHKIIVERIMHQHHLQWASSWPLSTAVLYLLCSWFWPSSQPFTSSEVHILSFQNTCLITIKMIISIVLALAQIPISTFSHIWVFVRQYGMMFVIIVIMIIIIIIYRKVKVSTLKHVWLNIDWSWGMGWWCKQF